MGLQMQRINQHKLRSNYTGSLEVHRLPTIVFQIEHLRHLWICQLRGLRQNPFEVCKEGWIVEGPFRGFFEVPFLDWEAVGNGEPVPMDFEVGGFTRKVNGGVCLERAKIGTY